MDNIQQVNEAIKKLDQLIRMLPKLLPYVSMSQSYKNAFNIIKDYVEEIQLLMEDDLK